MVNYILITSSSQVMIFDLSNPKPNSPPLGGDSNAHKCYHVMSSWLANCLMTVDEVGSAVLELENDCVATSHIQKVDSKHHFLLLVPYLRRFICAIASCFRLRVSLTNFRAPTMVFLFEAKVISKKSSARISLEINW